MSSLAETQARVRVAVIAGDATAIAPMLVGGVNARKRLAIHQRHYESSLVTALLGKFPATAWLVGTRFVEQHARAFVHQRPPHTPCIAEYGGDFPEFLAARPGAERVRYLRAFADLEWAIGAVSIAIDQTPMAVERLSALEPAALPDAVLALQPGVRLLRANWPVDDLMKLYLTDAAPEQLVLEPATTWIQVRGARGTFHIDRLAEGTFLFRHAIVRGMPIGQAAARALDQVPGFDPGRALAALFEEQAVIAMAIPNGGHSK